MIYHGTHDTQKLEAWCCHGPYRKVNIWKEPYPSCPSTTSVVAKEFYVNRLGFQVLYEASEDRKTGILGLERGTVRITLDCPIEGHGRDACVSLVVDSVDAYYKEWHQKVKIKRGPKNESWDARTFDLIDPFGNTIFVIGPKQE